LLEQGQRLLPSSDLSARRDERVVGDNVRCDALSTHLLQKWQGRLPLSSARLDEVIVDDHVRLDARVTHLARHAERAPQVADPAVSGEAQVPLLRRAEFQLSLERFQLSSAAAMLELWPEVAAAPLYAPRRSVWRVRGLET